MPVRTAISFVPQRWIVCALCSLAFAIISYKNFCFYAIANIVDSTTEKKKKPSGGCPFFFSGSSWERKELPLVLPDFYWNPNIMDIAKSAFYTGKMLMVVPAGVVSDIGYSRYVLGVGMLLVALGHLLLFTFTKSGVIVYLVENFFDGVGEAFIYPSIFTLISCWAPPLERNFFTALVVAGIFYGDTLGHVLFKVTYLGFKSWRVGNFITGTLGLLWLALCFIFIYHSPDESPFIHQQDSPTSSRSHRSTTIPLGLIRLHGIPWLKIVSSRSFLSLVLAFCSVDWAAYVNIWDSFASYQKYILHLPERFSEESTIMLISVIPASLMGGLFADWVNKHSLISKTVVKKAFIFISVFISSILQMTATLIGCNIMLFWVLSISAAYILGLANPVIYSTPIDLCSRHAGLLMGIMTGARTICAIFSVKVDEILTDNYNLNQWRDKFLFCSTLTFTLIVPFLFFGSGEAQNWKHSSHAATHADENPDEHAGAIELETSEEQKPPPVNPSPEQKFTSLQTKILNRLSLKGQ